MGLLTLCISIKLNRPGWSFIQFLISVPLSKEIHTAGMEIKFPVTEAVPVNKTCPLTVLTKMTPIAPCWIAKAVFSERCKFLVPAGASNSPILASTTFPFTSFPT